MKVLVALDDSAVSVRAAREARRLFPGAEFLVVNVSRRIMPWVLADGFGTVYATEFAELPIEGHEENLIALAESAGLDHADVLSLEGDPATAICDAADAHAVDVVVVGSHDKGIFRRVLDPSVAHAVVQGTYRPVLVVSGAPPEA